MINFNNQFNITFTLGDVSDFITAENFYGFNLYYEAGNIRPTLDMDFQLDNQRIIPYLNQGNILTLSFGRDELKKDILQFQLIGDDTDKLYSVGSRVKINACFYKPKFTNNIGYKNFDNHLSVDVLREISENNNFNFITNVGKTNDRQNWYRQSDTEWNFMKYVWLHSYLNEDTFFSYAMDCDNIYFYDMKKLAQGGAKWLVTNLYGSSDRSEVICVPNYKAIDNYGSTADLVGKNLQISVYNVDTGMLELQDYKLKSFTAIDTNKLNVSSSNSLDYSYGIISDDVHQNFIKAYNQNVRNNLMYQTFSIYATTPQFKDVKLLDPVMFNVAPQDNRLQGLGFITTIVYQFNPGQFRINLTINKEAPSGLKGDNLDVAS